ncbi:MULTISPECIES: hypothetical protein [unclassified Agrobacterium]|uniref:hypothetical protein n=1 Tax=unclassified Agrobacterium TaxID=2632611 RepID=UPI00244A3221|nr:MULTISPECIES: hypothetical protein [unclassified Agrobacterium]MDH0615896.1 hypothetical protein [Agrobacterium sp. GD03872]MDH0698011.1 hypothetical protein [Agrobacterium sp. GD03871]MDH1061096.1 hypothetical protein [Agrobacterium sp. GD03992]MDH2211872.1 hypothetical protein [Agrobacterium sp. GD03643]MDH2221264.1 hypothetical protein [Agrobacterium sp. GD03638]
MTATAEKSLGGISIQRRDQSAPVLVKYNSTGVFVKSGTTVTTSERTHAFDADIPVLIDEPVPGRDYGISINEYGLPIAELLEGEPTAERFFGGFHFAPGGNASAREGGDSAPAINPYSIWDVGFRPACADPRGMALIETLGGKLFWVDIYLLGVDHAGHGTSRAKAVIADGRDLPMKLDGQSRYKKLDYPTAVEIYAGHGKRLLGAEEFFAAAYGVKERASRDDEPTVTGSLEDNAVSFISKWGLFDITGTMWQWGTDGDPDNPRPSFFGGSWFSGELAGSRYANLACWPGLSSGSVGARGASDHLNHA